MPKFILVLSGDQILFSHVVPDNAVVHTVPVPEAAATVAPAFTAAPVATQPTQEPTPERVVKTRPPRGPISYWTDEETADLLSVVGDKELRHLEDYEPYVQFFPRHPSASALHGKHRRVPGVLLYHTKTTVQ